MDSLAYKYRLGELLNSVPRSFSIGDVTRVLEANYGINKSKFYDHKSILLGSTRTISDTDLAKYAAFFGVSEAEVRNYTPVEKKSRRTVFEILRTAARPTLDSVAALTGMVQP